MIVTGDFKNTNEDKWVVPYITYNDVEGLQSSRPEQW